MAPRILIVDDHEIVREGVRTLILRARPEWEICGEATDSLSAFGAVLSQDPDVVILDITMPGMSGLAAVPRIRQLNKGCRIVMFTMHESSSLEEEVKRAGAHGYVFKSEASRNLILAIETVLAGGTFYGKPNPAPESSGDDKAPSGMAFSATFGLGFAWALPACC